ncbi:MAG: long-chain-acyl-CoA synthetase, partial [Rhizomicrobium sp.]
MSNIPSHPPPPNDRSGSKAWLSALEMTSKIEMQPQRIFPRVVEALGEDFGQTPALFSLPENFSHVELAARMR